SGAQAISLAAESGAEVVVLVGYDCSLQNGLHWHGAHPQALRNPTQVSISKWQQQFLDTRKKHADLHILNASRSSAIQCFPRINLEAVIALLSSAVVQAPQTLLRRAECRLLAVNGAIDWLNRASYFFTLDPSPDNMRRVGRGRRRPWCLLL
ncbi:putative norphogenetic protein, partial [Escherichia coli O111:H8 str. CVM9574]